MNLLQIFSVYGNEAWKGLAAVRVFDDSYKSVMRVVMDFKNVSLSSFITGLPPGPGCKKIKKITEFSQKLKNLVLFFFYSFFWTFCL